MMIETRTTTPSVRSNEFAEGVTQKVDPYCGKSEIFQHAVVAPASIPSA
jgi:hypothetical protein